MALEIPHKLALYEVAREPADVRLMGLFLEAYSLKMNEVVVDRQSVGREVINLRSYLMMM